MIMKYTEIHPDEWREIFMKQSVNYADKLTSVISVHKALHWALFCLYQMWFQNKSELYNNEIRIHCNNT